MDAAPPRAPAALALPLWAGIAAALAAPLASFVIAAPLLRYAYVAAAVCAAAIWVDKAPRKFLSFIIFLFLFTPFVRRILDINLGYSALSHVMLAPYLGLALTAPYCFSFATSGRRHSAALAVLLLCCVWALWVGLFGGSAAETLLATLRWTGPVMLLGYMLLNGPRLEGGRPLLAPLAVFAAGIAVYAGLQYALVPPWDAYWIENSPIGSGPLGIIGEAAPFSIRVFGTMNSPGSLATALVVLAFLCLAAKGRGYMPVAAVALVALLLTMQRATVGALAVALALALVVGAGEMRRRVARLALVTAMIGAAGLAYLGAESTQILDRFQVWNDFASDGSLRMRLAQYANAGAWMDARPEGHGFGWRDALSASGPRRITLDSGLIDTFLTMGVVAGVAYFAGLAWLLLSAIGNARLAGGGLAAAGACAAFACFVQLPFGAVHVGELGVFGFFALGVALLPQEADPA